MCSLTASALHVATGPPELGEYSITSLIISRPHSEPTVQQIASLLLFRDVNDGCAAADITNIYKNGVVDKT